MLGLAMAYDNSGDSEKAKLHFERAKSIVDFKEDDTIEKFAKSYWHLKHFYSFKGAFDSLQEL